MGEQAPPPQQRRVRGLASLLLDLHRCQHGRLEGDPCGGCDGTSTGNRLLRPGMTIGHTLYGDAIVMPSWENHNDPAEWVQQG
jgi:hypothetical protein